MTSRITMGDGFKIVSAAARKRLTSTEYEFKLSRFLSDAYYSLIYDNYERYNSLEAVPPELFESMVEDLLTIEREGNCSRQTVSQESPQIEDESSCSEDIESLLRELQKLHNEATATVDHEPLEVERKGTSDKTTDEQPSVENKGSLSDEETWEQPSIENEGRSCETAMMAVSDAENQCSNATGHEAADISILVFNVGVLWKLFVGFHLKLYPKTLKEYRATLNSLCHDDEVIGVLSNSCEMDTKYNQYLKHYEHIKKNLKNPKIFHLLKFDRKCAPGIQLRMSTKPSYNDIVALDSIDLASDHPYQRVYHCARALETALGMERLGRVFIGIDRTENKIWVWGNCHPPKLDEVKPSTAVFVANLPDDASEEDIKKFFGAQKTVNRLHMRYYDDLRTFNGTCTIYFKSRQAAEGALTSNRKAYRGYLITVKYKKQT